MKFIAIDFYQLACIINTYIDLFSMQSVFAS